MDIVIELLRTHLFFLFAIGAVILIAKLSVSIYHSGFVFTYVFLSFFTLYSATEIEGINNSSRCAFMRWTNRLNYLFYIWFIVVAIYYIVTLNANQF